jgi:hypothetical protein
MYAIDVESELVVPRLGKKSTNDKHSPASNVVRGQVLSSFEDQNKKTDDVFVLRYECFPIMLTLLNFRYKIRKLNLISAMP